MEEDCGNGEKPGGTIGVCETVGDCGAEVVDCAATGFGVLVEGVSCEELDGEFC